MSAPAQIPKEYVPKRAAVGAVQTALQVPPEAYPAVRRDESVKENLHGVIVADPYRWLEDPDAEETKKFVHDQNELSSRVLAASPTRDRFGALLSKLMDYERFSTPEAAGGRYYYSRNSGLQAQSVVYGQDSLDAEARVLLDPNTLSEDGTVALTARVFSRDGSLLAYSLSSGGSDWQTVRVLTIDRETGEAKALEDELKNVKFSSLAWTHDGRGFFYNVYDAPDTHDAGTETGAAVNQKVAYHVVGTPQESDAVILAVPEHPEWMLGPHLTDDGRYLLLSISAGTDPVNQLWYVDLESLPRVAGGDAGALPDWSRYDITTGSEPLPVVKLVDVFEASYDYIGSRGSEWTFRTNADAPRYRLVRVDVSVPASNRTWTSYLAEHPRDLLSSAVRLGDGALLTTYLRDVRDELELRRWDDAGDATPVPLPGIATVVGFSGDHRSDEYFFKIEGFTEPGATYRGDASRPDVAPTLLRRAAATAFSPDDFETGQVFFASRDGTRVPMFIVGARGSVLGADGGVAPAAARAPHATLLYGYGGFNISLQPGFSAARLAWLLAYGGYAAIANIRGGGEYGTAWRDAGSNSHKQNTFDDFIAAGEYLVAQGFTTPAQLAIQGGSNGGLTVAAVAEQRPDLVGVVLAQVGVMDMLRFQKFTIGRAWTTDYGDADRPADFRWLLPISPVHNVAAPADGGQYPAWLLTTGDHDDRVVPLHTLKLTASLQHELAGVAGTQCNPILVRVETRAGHGAGKPTAMIIAEQADMLSFAGTAAGADWAAQEDKLSGATRPRAVIALSAI